MIPVVWMTAACAGIAILAIVAGAPVPEVLWGMAGPLGAAIVTWVLVSRSFLRAPERLPNLMTMAFAVKVLFFGGYVLAMLRVLSLTLAPFALSFSVFFVGVYVLEALFLQRLFYGTR